MTEQQPHIFFSNRLEVLYEELRDALYATGISPFARRCVIVPSAAMGTWIQLRMAKDPKCGIAAGLEIGLIEESLGKLGRLIATQDADQELPTYPREQELSLLIQATILETIESFSSFSEERQKVWRPLLEYLRAIPNYQRRKSEKRLIALCDSLAQLFAQYGRYGVKMLAEWEVKGDESWQADLWRQFKAEHSSLQFPYQFLDIITAKINDGQIKTLSGQMQVHLFGISFISKTAHDFLMHASHLLPINYYLLSPCQLFWSDICSDKESSRLKSFWAKKSVSEDQQAVLEGFLNSRNVLLGNFGRMGREMSLQIEQSTHQTSEFYVLPESIQDLPQYAETMTEDSIFENATGPLTLLQAIQADMTLLRTIDPEEKISLSSSDNSFQVHISPTKQREVEILYNVLVGLLNKHSKDKIPLTPGDIIVMVPDYMQYESAIATVFGSKSSLLDFQLVEMRAASKSSLVQGFLHLLSLASGRWEVKELLDLLDFPAFQRKQGFSFEDRRQIEKWIEKSGVYWGKTAAHRNEILQQAHRERTLVDETATGTWDYSRSRLLLGMAVEANTFEDSASNTAAPLEGVDSSQLGLLSKWIQLLNSLADDLRPMNDATEMTLSEWSRYLSCLKQAYFQIDQSDSSAVEDDLSLIEQIENINKSEKLIGERAYTFASIGERLKKTLNEKTSSFHEMHLQAIKFCPLLPMRALPAQVIVMLGMQEETFPRKDIKFSLNEMIGNPLADYSPSQTDFDRYLFLEALLSARKYFILSYVGYSFADSKESAPSLLIQELFDYADGGYTIGQISPSQHCYKTHPFESFDSEYFSSSSDLKCYQPEQYQLAQTYYTPLKTDPHRFISNDQTAPIPLIITQIHIKELSNFAKNPIKTYFNKTLGIYLQLDEEITVNEPFALGPLEKYQMRVQGIEKAFEPLINNAEKRGQLPPGMFKKLAMSEIQNDFNKMHANFSNVGLDPSTLFSIIFTDNCKTPYYSDDKIYMLPPLVINNEAGQQIKIIGNLKQVSSVGLLYHQDKDFKSLLKIWPQSLILQCAIKQFNLPIAYHAVSSKLDKPVMIEVENPAKQLASFIDYYHLGLKNPSLLIPEWVEAVINGDVKALGSAMQAVFNDPFSSFYNEYALWLFRDTDSLTSPEIVMQNWGAIARDQFAVLLEMVNASKKKPKN